MRQLGLSSRVQFHQPTKFGYPLPPNYFGINDEYETFIKGASISMYKIKRQMTKCRKNEDASVNEEKEWTPTKSGAPPTKKKRKGTYKKENQNKSLKKIAHPPPPSTGLLWSSRLVLVPPRGQPLTPCYK